MLNTALGAPVLVRCGAVPLFEGRVGRRKNRVAVRIERDVPRAAANLALVSIVIARGETSASMW